MLKMVNDDSSGTKMGLEDQVREYYDDKLEQFGPTPRGVDWNSEESQSTRFAQLCSLLPPVNTKFAVLDYGCGFGSLADYLLSMGWDADVIGFDLSKSMIEEARSRHPQYRWTSDKKELSPCDFVVASGIFNVRLNIASEEWLAYIEETLIELNEISKKGFAVNMLTIYSDKPFMKDYLFYADPLHFFDFCKRNFSRNVALLHDYELYEFTLIVRK